MSVFAPEELVSSYQSSVASLFAFANPAFQGFQAVVEFNLQAVKAAMAEGEDNLNDALSGKSPAEFLTRQSKVTATHREDGIVQPSPVRDRREHPS